MTSLWIYLSVFTLFCAKCKATSYAISRSTACAMLCPRRRRSSARSMGNNVYDLISGGDSELAGQLTIDRRCPVGCFGNGCKICVQNDGNRGRGMQPNRNHGRGMVLRDKSGNCNIWDPGCPIGCGGFQCRLCC